MSLELNNCPEQWANNCANYEMSCCECTAAHETNEGFYYRPIEKHLPKNKHPEHLRQKASLKQERRNQKKAAKPKTNYTRQGLSTELKTLSKLSATPTKASGRLMGDGDGYIETSYGKYYIEHKTRIAQRNELGPISAEWVKAKAQGCSIFITTSEHYGSIVTLSLETFKQLINYVQEPE